MNGGQGATPASNQMLVTIDTDQLVRDAATGIMDNVLGSEWRYIVEALQKQLGNEAGVPEIVVQVRQQVKEYKKLTMWRD
jgi:hypothetical protein